MKISFWELRHRFGFWSLWTIFAVLAITEIALGHADPPVSPEQYPLRASMIYPWWVIPLTLGVLALQTALMQLILGANPDRWTVWRVIVALLYTGPVMMLFVVQLMGHPSPGAVYIPVTPIFYALLLFGLSIGGLLLVLARVARRARR
jgi:hypothetical protein